MTRRECFRFDRSDWLEIRRYLVVIVVTALIVAPFAAVEGMRYVAGEFAARFDCSEKR
jgi:hypothetical protein